jgi:hypothetical protein
MDLTSKASSTVEIDHVDMRGQPEHFVLRKGRYSYKVLPGMECLTFGDVESVRECAPPDERNNGTVSRIVRIHDPVAAQLVGQTERGGWITRLVVLESNYPGLKVGSYYNHTTYGSSDAIRVANDSTPSFVGVFEDVTEEFLAAARPEELSARLDIGRVFQRVCIDAESGRAWSGWYGDGIIFAGNHAPQLQCLTSRERLGLLVDAGFKDILDFEDRCWRPHNQTADEAMSLLAGETSPLPSTGFEVTSYFRLHTDDKILSEVYAEMTADAVSALRGIDPPDQVLTQARSMRSGMAL